MSYDHEQPQPVLPGPAAPPETPVDAGSQALAEALRSSFAIVKFVMVALVAVFVFSGFFTVGPQEKAIILRFGKPVGEGDRALLGAGRLHWSFPYPIDEVVRVPIAEIQTVTSTVGWYAVTPEQELAGTEPPPRSSLDPAVDGYALTADGNIVHTRATLSYRIADPIRCVFGFAGDTNAMFSLAGVSNSVQNVLDNALLYAAARFKVDDILTRDRIGFQDAVQKRATELIEREKLGVIVDLCAVQSRPPRQLKSAFEAVVTAGQNRSKALNEARSHENQVLSKAGADAAGRINSAEAERTRLVQDITSAADNFRRLLPKYESSPNLFVQQRLVETLGSVFTNAQDKIFLPERADGQSRELRLLLNREPQKPKTETPAQP
jgi:membrane protease subunit HflK